MSEHTKGPWRAEKSTANWAKDSGGNWRVIVPATPRLLHGDREEILTSALSEANARLIAAAPALYAACQEFVRKCECGEARSVRSYAEMKAALALADGSSQATPKDEEP